MFGAVGRGYHGGNLQGFEGLDQQPQGHPSNDEEKFGPRSFCALRPLQAWGRRVFVTMRPPRAPRRVQGPTCARTQRDVWHWATDAA